MPADRPALTRSAEPRSPSYAPEIAAGPARPAASEGTGRVVALDGLRGIALILVLVHNVGGVTGALDSLPIKLYAAAVNTGWIGVQIFFALSGYLITRILLDSKGGPGMLRRFYVRRTLRIFPIAYVILAVVFLLAPHFGVLSPLTERHARNPLWYWSYLANWMMPFHGTVAALGHFWSLAVEEQFYLLWPPLVYALRERTLVFIGVAGIAFAPIVRAGVFLVFPQATAASAAYNWTIARGDALAMGAVVALLLTSPERLAVAARWAQRILIPICIALGAMTVALHGLNALELSVLTVGQTLVGLASACLVIVCLAPWEAGTFWAAVGRVLSRPWLVSVGKYSYAMYLIHVPLHKVLHPFTASVLGSGAASIRLLSYAAYIVVTFILTYALAILSWNVVEQPFLRLKRFFPMPTRPALAR